MGSNVRSVTVRLNAAVAGYIKDIDRAGDATEKAFDRVQASTARARESIVATDKATDKLATTTRVASPSMRRLSTDVDRLSVTAVRGTASIDQLSGRLRLLLDLAATAGPGLLPIGAAGVVGVGGLAALFGGATVGALALIGATQGVGDALKAVEDARLEPTVENLRKAEEAMSRISPEAREWVTRFQELRPLLAELRDAGAEEFFPGLTASLDSMELLAPAFERVMAASGRAGGDAIARGAESLTTDRWAPFYDFLAEEIPDAIENATQLVGSLAHGAAEMWMAFDPSNDRFIDWLVDVGEGFDRWASSPEGRDDVRDFLAYVEKTAPKVEDFFVSLATALTEVSQAAAPLGGPALDALTAILELIANVADSDLGTPLFTGLAALALYTRAVKILGTTAGTSFQQVITGQRNLSASAVTGFRRASGATRTFGTDLLNVARYGRLATDSSRRLTSQLGTFTRTAGMVGGVAIAATGAADSIGLTNTASLALMGTMAGPWGAALGAGTGLLLDIKSGASDAAASIKSMNEAAASGDLSRMEAELAAANEKFAKYIDGDDTFGDVAGAMLNIAVTGGRWGEELAARAELERKVAYETAQAREEQIAYSRALEDGTFASAAAGNSLQGLTDALKTHQATVRGALDAQYAWGQAVIDARKQMKDGKDGFNEFTEAGQQNMAVAREMADVWNRDMEAAQEAGLTYDRVRAKIEHFARAQGMSKDAAEDLARELVAIPDEVSSQVAVQFEREKLEEAKAAFRSLPKTVRTDIKANGIPQTEAEIDALVKKYKLTEKERRALVTLTDQASPTIAGIIARLNSIPKTKHTTVTTTFQTFYAPPKGKPASGSFTTDPYRAPLQKADGGFIRGPGGPREDAIAAWLSNGEYVIQAAAVDRYGVDFFDRLNAMRLATGGPVGYAAGGRVRTSADDEAHAVARGLRSLRRELAAAQKAMAAERRQRERLVDRRSNLVSGVRSGLGDDIWRPGNEWSSGGPNSDLRANIAEIRAFDKLTGRLKRKGVKGGALDAILAEGDLATAQAYAGMSKADLREYQRLHNVQRRELNRVSGDVGDAAYGGLIRESNRELRGLRGDVRKVKNAVERADRGNRAEQGMNRRSTRKGAGAAARSRPRGQMP